MKFLAIDTSAAALVVVAVNGETVVKRTGERCAQTHSVRLMDEIDGALAEANLTAGECDFFACAVGPGSFTGIRIGIATIKGLCFATGKKAVAVTSLDAIAYAERSGKRVALIDALHGNYYACAYGGEACAPAFLSAEEADSLVRGGYTPLYQEETDRAEGLYRAVLDKCDRTIEAGELFALYLRKSSAEEKR